MSTDRRASNGNGNGTTGRRESQSTYESMTEVMYTTPVWDPFVNHGQAGDEILFDTPFASVTRRLLPVTAVAAAMALLYVEYVFIHCFRLLQYDQPAEMRVSDDVDRGSWEMFTFHIFTGLVVYCFVMCIQTHPGTIPDTPEWINQGDAGNQVEAGPQSLSGGRASVVESKQTGSRRSCKWCFKYKPDRCHHCKICKLCILRMDHHCPWVNNCIGFLNHKYFFLLIVYSVIDLWLISFRMFDTVWWSTRIDVSIFIMLLLIVGETLATFLLVLSGSFLAFHIWLMLKAMTTLEFCEKKLKNASYDSSIYCRSPHANVCAVLGPNPLLWLLPTSLPLGDGVDWSVDSTGFAQSAAVEAAEERNKKMRKQSVRAARTRRASQDGASGAAGSADLPTGAPVFGGGAATGAATSDGAATSSA